MQPAVHDVTDGSVVRAWLNVPLSSCLDQDIFKATNIVKCFAAVGTLGPERGLPSSVLAGAAGFAIMSTAKVRPARVCLTAPLHAPGMHAYTAIAADEQHCPDD